MHYQLFLIVVLINWPLFFLARQSGRVNPLIIARMMRTKGYISMALYGKDGNRRTEPVDIVMSIMESMILALMMYLMSFWIIKGFIGIFIILIFDVNFIDGNDTNTNAYSCIIYSIPSIAFSLIWIYDQLTIRVFPFFQMNIGSVFRTKTYRELKKVEHKRMLCENEIRKLKRKYSELEDTLEAQEKTKENVGALTQETLKRIEENIAYYDTLHSFYLLTEVKLNAVTAKKQRAKGVAKMQKKINALDGELEESNMARYSQAQAMKWQIENEYELIDQINALAYQIEHTHSADDALALKAELDKLNF